MRWTAAIVSAVLVGGLAACAAGGDVAGEPVTVEPDAGADAGAGAGADPLPEQEPGADSLSGTLGGDADLEGGCAWLSAADGTRYEVIYPAGFEVRTDPVALIGPDGETVAEEGQEVTVSGVVDSEQMSFCQIGPIFVATDVQR
jgi:hypothetical protein